VNGYRHLKVVSQKNQGSAWLHVYEGLPQGLPSSCMLFALYLDECVRKINQLCDHSYPFVDDNTLLVIQKVYENRKAFIARLAKINQKIKAIYSLYDAEVSEPKSLMIPIHFRPKQLWNQVLELSCKSCAIVTKSGLSAPCNLAKSQQRTTPTTYPDCIRKSTIHPSSTSSC